MIKVKKWIDTRTGEVKERFSILDIKYMKELEEDEFIKCANSFCNKKAELGNGLCLLCDKIAFDIRMDLQSEKEVALENAE